MFFMRDLLRKMLRNIFLAVMIIAGSTIFLAVAVPAVYADGSCTSPPSGSGTCSRMNDIQGKSLNCGNYYGGSNLHNTYENVCLRTWIMSGTGDGERYSWYDMWVTPNPDSNNAVFDYNYYRADNSTPGTLSTIETRVWSLQRSAISSCQAACDQENYYPLQAPSKCDPTGDNGPTLGATLKVGYIQISWSQSDPIYYGCIDQAPADPYSAYFDYTMLSSGAGGVVSQDFTSGQYSENGYATRIIRVGYSAKSHFIIIPAGGDHWISSPNLSDTFLY